MLIAIELFVGFNSNRMWEQLKRRSSYQTLPTVEPRKLDIFRDLHHPIFQSIRIAHVNN